MVPMVQLKMFQMYNSEKLVCVINYKRYTTIYKIVFVLDDFAQLVVGKQQVF